MKHYDEIANNVEKGFIEPLYLEQKIRYVDDEKSAEVSISAQHNLDDHLILGIIALQHSIDCRCGEILVYNNVSPNIETIGVASDWHSPFRKVGVDSSKYVQICNPIESIYKGLYKGDFQVTCLGLSFSMLLMLKFSKHNKGIPNEIMANISFNNFDDLDTAQHNAFYFIKNMAGSIIAGTYYAMEHGEN